MKKSILSIISAIFFSVSFAQYKSNLSQQEWADSVFKSLSTDEKIAQLMIIRAHSNFGADHVAGVTDLITKYNVGALCFFQGGPLRQANLTNLYQSIAKTPLLVTIDGEFGLGMRLDSVQKFPYQSTLGALTDESIIYKMGRAVGDQMKRIGVHVNYAPTVDVNNNPNNPVIGYRSFGEDKLKVARFGVAYMKGMQDAGIMATAKHFPGHGDTEVDSHQDLPVINKTLAQLDSLELYPFRELIKAGVGSVMIAHLFIPAIDKTANRPTSLSQKAITDLLRKKLGFNGITFTDALEMKGITKFFPAGEAAVQAIMAGNDMLCLPDDVPAAIAAVKDAVQNGRIEQKDIDEKLMKILMAKYALGLNKQQTIDTNNLLADLNSKTSEINTLVAKNIITVLKNEQELLPIREGKSIAYVGIGAAAPTAFGKRLAEEFEADEYYLSYRDDDKKVDELLKAIHPKKYEQIIIGIHNYSLRPANNFNISNAAIRLWSSLQATNTATVLFGNAYAAKNFRNAKALVAMYQDDAITQEAAADFLASSLPAKGKLPVTTTGFVSGTGISMLNYKAAPTSTAWVKIDSIISHAILKKAFPGAVVLAVQDGAVKYHKAFGNFQYNVSQPVATESIFDLASVTKISATTLAVMKLYEDGKLDLKKKLGDYLPWTSGSNKASISVRDLLLHQGGLVPFIAFYKETIDASGKPMDSIYSDTLREGYTIPVAQHLYLRNDWNDTLFKRILASPLTTAGKYVYSDNDFIFLGKIVEAITGLTLDQYVAKTFYEPLGMQSTGFLPLSKFGEGQIVPTESEPHFRRQLLHGYVHDEGASLFGGVSGHAGLFSNAFDLAKLYQMLMNGGEYNGKRIFKPETIKLFTAYHSNTSRRGLGFDKPEKDNAIRKEPYPSISASPETFGHTGYTGTCVWADPKTKLVYILLTNRVYPTRENNKLSQLSVRANVQEAIYEAIKKDVNEVSSPANSVTLKR